MLMPVFWLQICLFPVFFYIKKNYMILGIFVLFFIFLFFDFLILISDFLIFLYQGFMLDQFLVGFLQLFLSCSTGR